MQLKENILFDDRYLLKELLGSGNFSDVWLVEDTKDNNVKRVLKVFVPGNGLDDDGVQLFSKEFDLLSYLNHSHLLRPLHFGFYERSPYLIFLYCERGSVAKLTGKISENAAWRLMHDIASGLAYLHAQAEPVIHQNININNVLIDNNENFLISDFVVSSKARNALCESADAKNTVVATPQIHPECLGKDHVPCKSSDIWSLGVMLFILLEGDTPFGSGGLIKKSDAAIPKITGDYSQNLKEIVYRMLAKEPRDRPTAGQLVEWVDAHNKGELLFEVKKIHKNKISHFIWKNIKQAVSLIAGIATIFSLIFLIFSVIKPSSSCDSGAVELLVNKREIRNHIVNFQKIEDRIFNSSNFIDDDARFDNLLDYFYDVNPRLKEIFDEQNDIIFIIGPAGSGKSYLRRAIRPVENENINVQTVELSKIFRLNNETKVQLSLNTPESNLYSCSLPAPTDMNISTVIEKGNVVFEPDKINYLFIDDCDEFHPDAITQLFESVIFSEDTDIASWKFVFFGRPEGFRGFYRYLRRRGSEKKILQIYIKNAVFSTTGDVSFRINEYKEYRKNFEIDPYIAYERIIDDKTAIFHFARNEFISGLEAGNQLIDELARNMSDLNELKSSLLGHYLKRSYETHNRYDQDLNQELYKALLKQAAFEYMDKVDTLGFFEIRGEDETKVKICINNKSTAVSVRTKDLLEFSGLVDMKSITETIPHYRFYPIWIHRYLLEEIVK